MNFVELGNERKIQNRVNNVGRVGDKLIFGGSKTVLFKKVFVEIFVGGNS